MARMSEFIAFEAAIELLKERGKAYIIDDVYRKCKEQALYPKEQIRNYVKEIYEPFTADEISKKIAELLTPVGMRSEEHTSELQSRPHLVCRLLLEKKKKI